MAQVSTAEETLKALSASLQLKDSLGRDRAEALRAEVEQVYADKQQQAAERQSGLEEKELQELELELERIEKKRPRPGRALVWQADEATPGSGVFALKPGEPKVAEPRPKPDKVQVLTSYAKQIASKVLSERHWRNCLRKCLASWAGLSLVRRRWQLGLQLLSGFARRDLQLAMGKWRGLSSGDAMAAELERRALALMPCVQQDAQRLGVFARLDAAKRDMDQKARVAVSRADFE